MSVDEATVRRIAHLSRIAIGEEDVGRMQGELNAFVEQLNEVDVGGVEPMSSVTPMQLKRRTDTVTEGGDAARVLATAPRTEDGFFVVPKIVE